MITSGDTLEVVIHCSLASGQVIRDGTVQADFWAPGKDMSEPPDYTLPAVWDQSARGFSCWADTEGWAPGTWTVRGRVDAGTERGQARGRSDPFPVTLRAA